MVRQESVVVSQPQQHQQEQHEPISNGQESAVVSEKHQELPEIVEEGQESVVVSEQQQQEIDFALLENEVLLNEQGEFLQRVLIDIPVAVRDSLRIILSYPSENINEVAQFMLRFKPPQ